MLLMRGHKKTCGNKNSVNRGYFSSTTKVEENRIELQIAVNRKLWKSAPRKSKLRKLRNACILIHQPSLRLAAPLPGKLSL